MTTIETETYGSSAEIPQFFLPLILRALGKKNVQLWLANKHACPIPDEVEYDYGLDKSIYRYNECNRVSKKIWSIAWQINPELYAQLTQWKKRSPGEKVGKYEKLHVPEIHLTELSPLSTPTGYALARIVICIMNALKKRKNDSNIVWSVVQKYVEKSQTPEELLAHLSDYALKCDVSPVEILNHVFAQGVLDEEKTSIGFYVLSLAMQRNAREVMQFYDGLQIEERTQNQILTSIPNPPFIKTY